MIDVRDRVWGHVRRHVRDPIWGAGGTPARVWGPVSERVEVTVINVRNNAWSHVKETTR